MVDVDYDSYHIVHVALNESYSLYLLSKCHWWDWACWQWMGQENGTLVLTVKAHSPWKWLWDLNTCGELPSLLATGSPALLFQRGGAPPFPLQSGNFYRPLGTWCNLKKLANTATLTTGSITQTTNFLQAASKENGPPWYISMCQSPLEGLGDPNTCGDITKYTVLRVGKKASILLHYLMKE